MVRERQLEIQCLYCKRYLLGSDQKSCSGGQCSSAYELIEDVFDIVCEVLDGNDS